MGNYLEMQPFYINNNNKILKIITKNNENIKSKTLSQT